MTTVVAYKFTCDKTLSDMLGLLRDGTPWQWHERFSDIWDEYLSANMPERDVIVKVSKKLEPFQRPDPEDRNRFVFEMKFLIPEARTSWKEFSQAILDDLVPVLGAKDIKRTGSYN